jgi:predicted alpha/beta-fold hydrolase
MFWRTCDGNDVNAVARSYHSGASDDAAFAIQRALEATSGPVCLIGVSLGGNVLLKWMGENGDRVDERIVAAAGVSVPYDLARASEKLERGFSRVYTRFFLGSLKRKALAKCARYPERFNAARISGSRTLRDFDDAVTGPLHGFESAAQYYERCSSIEFLADIRVPTLLLNARNDPFLPRAVLTKVEAIAERNPALRCVFPENGGHVGFIEGSLFRPSYWMERYCLDWLTAALSSHHSATISAGSAHV